MQDLDRNKIMASEYGFEYVDVSGEQGFVSMGALPEGAAAKDVFCQVSPFAVAMDETSPEERVWSFEGSAYGGPAEIVRSGHAEMTLMEAFEAASSFVSSVSRNREHGLPVLDGEEVAALAELADAAARLPGESIDDAWASFVARKQALRESVDRWRARSAN